MNLSIGPTIKGLLRVLPPIAVVVLLSVPVALNMAPPTAMATVGCGLAQAAFCDTFDQSAGTGNRSGDLNGTVWGVSRVTSAVNTSQGQLYDWFPTNAQLCGGSNVLPDQDVRICNGQLNDAVNDGHVQTILAMYPKQPFDIAGRTGVVVFDVSDDTQGSHAAWPEFWYTDQPVPGPNGQTLSGISTTPRNGFGLSLASVCNQATNQACYPTNGCPNTNDVSLDSMTVVRNYVAQSIAFTQDGCVREPSAAGQLNHFEVHLSTSGVQVYGTDAGAAAPLKLIAHAAFTTQLPLSRGLIWVEDVHYAACKFTAQCDHNFTWDNVGFDGPVLARDLTFDVPEAKIIRSDGTMQLGWDAPTSTANPLVLTIPGVTNIGQASAALLTLTFGAQTPDLSISYSLNGGTWKVQPWVFDGNGYTERTIAMPVALGDVVAGNNTLRLATSPYDAAVANIDLVLVGAGGGGVVTPTNTPTPTSTVAAPTGTATPTSTPTPTSTAVPTSTSTATATPQTCSVVARLNGVDTRFTRPLSFCTNQ